MGLGTVSARINRFLAVKSNSVLASRRSPFGGRRTTAASPDVLKSIGASRPFRPNQDAGSLRIMPMGDSITHGLDVPGGYRLPLYDILTGFGYTVDYVGNQLQVGDSSPDPDHWGRPGWGIANTDSIIGGRSYVSLQANESPNGSIRNGLVEDLADAISPKYFSTNSRDTNILLLMVGTNDVVHQVVEAINGARPAGDRNNDGKGEQQDRIAESNFDRLEAFINEVNARAASSGLKLEVVLSSIPDISNAWNRSGLRDPISNVMRQEIREYNALIVDNFSNRTYSNIEIQLVDQFSAVGQSLADGIHPTPLGYQAMAQAWWAGIQQALA